jgi:hypothetical protein
VVARIGEEHVEIGSAKGRGDGQYLLGVAASPVQHDDGSGGVRGREQPAEQVTLETAVDRFVRHASYWFNKHLPPYANSATG